MSSVMARKSMIDWLSSRRTSSRSSFDSTGWSSLDQPAIARIIPVEHVRRGLPMKVISDITSSSRIESIGGLVTWANICLK